MNWTMLAITIGIVSLTIAVILLNVKTSDLDKEMTTLIASETPSDQLERVDMQTAKQQDEINEIIKRLNAIAEDIKRLDETQTRDHSDLVDIRERYILWREPADKGAGVTWAKDYTVGEDENNG